MRAGPTRPCFFIANFPLGFLPTVELSITICIVQFGEIAQYGKKPTLLDLNEPPQHLVASPPFRKTKSL